MLTSVQTTSCRVKGPIGIAHTLPHKSHMPRASVSGLFSLVGLEASPTDDFTEQIFRSSAPKLNPTDTLFYYLQSNLSLVGPEAKSYRH